MAGDPHIRNVATNQIAARSGQFVKARGKLSSSSITRSGRGTPVVGTPWNRKSAKRQVNHLSYPFDVDIDPMQGHYIIFNISSITEAILAAEKRKKDIAAFIPQAEAAFNVNAKLPPQLAVVGGDGSSLSAATRKNFVKERVLDKFGPEKVPEVGTLNRSLRLASMPRKTLETSIALYMPPSVSVNYGINYAESEIGALAEIGTGIMKAFTQGGGDTKSKLSGALDAMTGAAAQEGLQSALLKGLDAIAPGVQTMAELESGKVITPRMELMFKGVGRRNFSFTFAFIPKSEKEAKIVENIIYTFKENMHPEYANPTTRKEMKIPNTFEISYMYQNKTNDFLNKISTCFLTGMSVNYGGDRFTAYEPTESRLSGGPRGPQGSGPPPQKSSVTLNFSELETLSKQHIKEGH